MGDWTFFSNYGHVLVCLARDRQARLRDVAADVGITERAVQKIVRDMQEAGIITVSKQGRCNRYRINRRKSLRHGLESHCSVGKLLNLVVNSAPGQPVAASAPTSGPEAAAPPALAGDRTATSAEAAGSAAQPETGRPEKGKPDKGKPEKRKAPGIDVRQQGSLF